MKKALIFFTLFSLFVGLCGCKPANPFIFTHINGEIELDEKEKIFKFADPFIPKKQINEICFTFDQKFKEDSNMKAPVFPDGFSLNIESVLIDNNGNRYYLDRLSERGENILCYLPNDKSWYEISKSDVSFVELTVRSNRKIKVLKVEWKSFNAWDMK